MISFRLITSLTFLLSLLSPLFGIQTRSVIHETFADFQSGELSGISLRQNGNIRLAPTVSEIAGLVETIIWSAAYSPSGDLFVAAGQNGKVYRISPSGEVSDFVKTDEIFVRAIAFGKDGNLYLGSSPDGKVYRADSDGNLEPFFEPRETYIWALHFDENENLFVATGEKGRIYRIPTNSKPGTSGEIHFETSENHISTLASDQNGNLLAGTAPNGHLYRIDSRKKAFLLFNSPDEEIRRILPDKSGDFFVSTFPKKKPEAPSGSIAEALASLSSGKSDSDSENRAAGSAGNTKQPQQPGRIYRIRPDGFYQTWWGLNNLSIYSLIHSPDGSLLAGSGSDGRIFSIESPNSWELRQSLPTGGEVSLLLQNPKNNQITALSGNPARIFRLDFNLPEKGTFLSEVFDSKQISKWGRFYTESTQSGDTGFTTEVRTGNSKKADDNWSDWQTISPDGNPSGDLHPARYLQYRLTLSNPETEIKKVRFFHRHANSPPAITAIRIVNSGLGIEQYPTPPQQPSIDPDQLFKSAPSEKNSPEPRSQFRGYEKQGTITIAWKADDPDKDDLRFRVKLRKTGTRNWQILRDDLDSKFFSFNSIGMEEGLWETKIIATDHRSNPPGEALTAERISEPFLIDNTPPEIEITKTDISGRNASLELLIKDKWSIITGAEMILDGGEPKPLFPTDRLFDSREKSFHIDLQNLDPGDHTLIISATDEQQNVAVRQIPIRIGQP